ncbi:PAS domain-containing sensor histidine kinase [Massilia soli]|uniref:histidine kinase n=1 Tax=Massilia soli TaxID=2792854 RepID=A0ABS7SLM8_9BURK|nr:PAS domain-containing protein [Massilia soli]MBZ2207084.1 PAS domain-containing protein [Massilia soli]
MGTVEMRWIAASAGLTLLAGLAVVAAVFAVPIPLALSGVIAAAASGLMIHNERLRRRVHARTAQLERSNQQLRDEIATRSAAENALAASERRLHDILSTLPMPVVVKDAQSRIALMNHAAEEKWGVRFEQAAGGTGAAWMPAAYMQAVLADEQAVLAGGKVVVRESQIPDASGARVMDVESYKKPVYDVHGNPLSLICVYVDITQRKHAEGALQRSFLQLRELTAKLELLKEDDHRRIAQGIHDDLGQNLLALKIDVEMLHARASQRHPRLKRRVGHVLDTLDATIRSVRAIINDLHPSTLQLGLPVALEWLVGQFEKRSGIRCALHVAGAHVPMQDPRRTSVIFRIVQEALVHVLGNAGVSRVDVALVAGPEQLAITLADDGEGIGGGDAAQQRLRALRERVDVFGGDVGIECAAAGGTRLSILIPTETGATAA